MKSYVVAIQFKATEQWFIYADEILKGDFSNESYRQVVPHCIVKFNPFVCEWNPMARPLKKRFFHWRVISDKLNWNNNANEITSYFRILVDVVFKVISFSKHGLANDVIKMDCNRREKWSFGRFR